MGYGNMTVVTPLSLLCVITGCSEQSVKTAKIKPTACSRKC